MATEIFTNQATTTVSSGGTTAPVAGTVQTWTVASSSSFPAASNSASPATQFHVIDTAANFTSEIIAVTNVSGTTWTVTRGAESTTPVAHSGGFSITQVVTAAGLAGFVQYPSLPLSIANGGTGQATGSAALSALTGEPVPMNSNPSFGSGTSPWTGNNGATIATSTVWSYAGGNSLRITPDGSSANPGAQSETTIPVSASTVYTASCMLYCPTGYSGLGEIVINWFTAGHAYISTSVYKPYAIPPAIQIQMLGYALTSPSNAAFASIVPQLLGTPSASVVFYVDDCALLPGSNINAGQVVRSDGITAQLALLQPGDIPGAGEWINAITQFGAKGDGATDDTLSIQLALNAAGNGQVVYLPYTFFSYRTSAPLVVPPGVRLLGSRMNVLIRQDFGTTIKPLSSWAKGSAAGAAVILICDRASGGFSATSQEQCIENINIDGTALPGGTLCDGIQLLGNVPAGRLEKINVWQVTGTAFNQVVNGSGGPSTWRYTALASNNNGKNGYVINGSDSTFIDCLSLGDGTSGTFDGWSLAATGNCRFIACRAEWATGNGYGLDFSASYNAALTMNFVGCSTDRNNHDGFHLTGSSSVAVNITGCFFNRDGRNNSTGGGGYAQIGVTAFQGSLNLAGVSTSCGQNDDGSGTNSAQYGLSVTSMASKGAVKAAACTFQGNTSATNYDGSAAQYLISPDCTYATGGGSGPTIGATPLLPVAYGGTNASTAASAFNNLSPMTTLGDIEYESGASSASRLPGNTTSTKNFLTQTGTGTVSAAPAWGTLAAGDLPTVTIAKGGTGQTTQQAAIDALAGTQSSGTYLRSDGTHSTLAVIQAGDVPTLNQSTTGTAAGLSATLAIGSGGTGSSTRNFAGLLTPTAVKTTTYTASAGDFVPCDTTSGSFTVTLPTAPADLTVVAVKQVVRGGTNTVTVACAGADVFNVASGATSATLTLASQAISLQYKSSSAIWYVLVDDLPLGQLDSRYVAQSSLPLAIGSGGTGQTTQQTAINALAGAQTNNRVLAGDGTNITVRALAAADLPAATTGAQGAVKLPAASLNIKPSNPTSTTSTTLVMMGMGSTAAFTPSSSGLVMVIVTGNAYINTATQSVGLGPRYGTGTAPSNAAAVTGTRWGTAGDPSIRPSSSGAANGLIFAFNDILALTPATAYWFDVAISTTNAADGAFIQNVSFSFVELVS